MKKTTQTKIAAACLFLLCIFISKISVAQNGTMRCGTAEEMQKILKAHPEMLQEFQKEEARLEAIDKTAAANGYKRQEKTQTVIYTIPVVFHVLHQGGPENISDAQILDQMRILNEDFRKRNADTSDIVPAFQSVADDAGFQFRLAQLDPNGNCTNGIDRIYTPLAYHANDNSKINQWDPSKYLNIWTAEDPLASGAAAYTHFPGGVASTDGIMCLANYVGSIGTSNSMLSRTLSHEIGHYFNLLHTWGPGNSVGVACGDDGVSDTPVTKGYQSCDTTNCMICNSGIEENVQNQMDYSWCGNMFTAGQVVRMRTAATSSVGNRNNLWTTSNLIATGVSLPDVLCYADFVSNSISNVICPGDSITYTNISYNGHPSSWNWTFAGGTPSTSTDSVPSVVYTTAGLYDVSLSVSNASGTAATTKTAFIRVNPSAAMYSNPFYYEGFETAAIPNNDWYINNLMPGGNTWIQTNNAASTGTHSVMITNTSASAGNIDELIGPSINMALLTGSSVGITFKEAYAKRDTTSADVLKVYVSTDCGKNWIIKNIYNASVLSTAPAQTVNFVPAAGQWATKTVNLTSFSSNTDLFFKFRFISQGGNNIYLDDINISGATGINEITNELNFNIYPNPFTSETTISFDESQKNTTIIIRDIVGKEIKSNLFSGKQFILEKGTMKPGIYFIQITDEKKNTVNKRIVIQ